MSQCPGCGISYCLDCEKAVEPNVYRCEECRKENERTDPFAITAREQAKELADLERRNKDLNAENIMCRRINVVYRKQIDGLWPKTLSEGDGRSGDHCAQCARELTNVRMRLDNEASVCLQCWEHFPDTITAFTNRLVCGMARLELENIELKRMGGYCDCCTKAKNVLRR